jgi:hypothetical protein
MQLNLEHGSTLILLENLLGDTWSPVLVTSQNFRFLHGRLLLATSTTGRAVLQLHHTMCLVISIIWEGISRIEEL